MKIYSSSPGKKVVSAFKIKDKIIVITKYKNKERI